MAALDQILPMLGQRTAVMGILNITPDSFSDGGQYHDLSLATERAEKLFEQGADIIDVGGESTRPGAPATSEDVEIDRVIPVIEALVARGLSPLSVDTSKAEVARRARDAGADLVNDISAGRFDPSMLPLVADRSLPCVLMHTRSRPESMQTGTWTYEGGVVEAVRSYLAERRDVAVEAGIPRSEIVLDPGIGFGKTLPENLAILRNLEAFKTLGCRILVGTSRKRFLGTLTGRPVGERALATAASVAVTAAYGADIVRVHDVQEIRETLAVADAICRAPKQERQSE